MPNCKNCNQLFTVYPEDEQFYRKIDVPPPTHCPACRQQRRLAFRNERTIYSRKCDLTGQNIVSVYPENSPYKVYEAGLWHSDQWEGLDFGREFDFTRPFFEQFRELQLQVPRPSLAVIQNSNSPFVNQCWNTKDSYLCFDMGFTENALYCSATYHCKDVVDCFFIHGSELSYYLIDSQNCFGCRFLQDCSDCHDAFFSYDCKGCSNIAFCYNLRNQQCQIFNRSVTPQEFDDFVKKMKVGSYQDYQQYFSDWRKKVIEQAIHKLNHNIKAVNCSGDYLLNSKNCHHCFNCDSSEDLRYCNRMDERIYSSIDLDQCSICELIYEGMCITGNNLKFCFNIWSASRDCAYCELTISSSDCFGCIGIKHKKYCILNKQYTEEEYKKMIPKIIEHLKTTGEWGEFFSIAISPFAYNETVANEFYPLSREAVLARGWRWQEDSAGVFGRETLAPQNLPDKIGEVTDSILKEVLVCSHCQKNYKIIAQELKFYREQGLPLPRQCNFCRHLERLTFRNPQRLWQRKCSLCAKIIESTYPADYAGKVFCDQCYQKEIY